MRGILIVDDESSMRFVLRIILENAGYEILEAHNGAAALERMNEWRPAPVDARPCRAGRR